jgi:hypothetical protein
MGESLPRKKVETEQAPSEQTPLSTSESSGDSFDVLIEYFRLMSFLERILGQPDQAVSLIFLRRQTD